MRDGVKGCSIIKAEKGCCPVFLSGKHMYVLVCFIIQGVICGRIAVTTLFSPPYSYCSKEVYNKENLFNSLNYDVAAKKRKKDILNSKTKTQCKPFVLNVRM
ncbi:F-box only protein 32 [Cricetulus griseus]|uniref:F-box only protein 32 n=1 Tax=Cricetulus griseus TaxID=10029 RepID=G3IPL9_CRIGR|nr:F-box only protein 32 [Cricetulus griseus]